MKKFLMTTALVLATGSVALAAGEGQMNKGAADSSIPGATNPNTSNAPAKPGTTGAGARDSSIPGATNPNTSNAPAKPGTTGAPAGDSSLPGATNPNGAMKK
jgi:hypothetical protein